MEDINYRNAQRLSDELSKHKVRCKCGHTMVILRDQRVCGWCGRLVFKDKKTEFFYRMRGIVNEKANKEQVYSH